MSAISRYVLLVLFVLVNLVAFALMAAPIVYSVDYQGI